MMKKKTGGAFGRPANMTLMRFKKPRLARDYESSVRIKAGMFEQKPWPFARLSARLVDGVSGMWR